MTCLVNPSFQVEDVQQKYKPQILDAPQWQTIDLNSLSDESPFNTEKRRITRKQGEERDTKFRDKLDE